MFVWSSEVSCINSTPFFRLKIVSTNVKTYECRATLLYIVLKKGDIIMTLGNDNAGNWGKCVMLCSVSMICIYKFHFFRLAMAFHCHWYMHDRFTLFPQHTGLCLRTAHKVKQTVENGWRYDIYWSASSSRHFLRFLSNIFKKQTRSLCFTPLLFGMTQNDLPTKWIFIKIHYYDVAFFNRKWLQQKQFSPTFRNIVLSEAKAL
jgi:hypothetical protein